MADAKTKLAFLNLSEKMHPVAGPLCVLYRNDRICSDWKLASGHDSDRLSP